MNNSIIVYHSITGNTKRFVEKIIGLTKLNVIELKEYQEQVRCGRQVNLSNSNIHFITMTTGIGEVHKDAQEFISKYGDRIVSVCSTGNQNWGKYYCNAANIISDKLHIPKFKVELSGDEHFAQEYVNFINNIKV